MSLQQSNPVQTISSRETLRAAARQLEQHRVGSLVVTDDQGQALGMVTDRDLVVRGVARGYDQDATPVEKVMSAPLFSADAGAEPEEVADLMRKLGVRRVPVLEEGKAVELLALDDVVVHLAERFSELAMAVQAPACGSDAEQADQHGLLEHIEESFAAIRQRAAGVAWRAEAAFFDELDHARQSLRQMVTGGGRGQGD